LRLGLVLGLDQLFHCRESFIRRLLPLDHLPFRLGLDLRLLLSFFCGFGSLLLGLALVPRLADCFSVNAGLEARDRAL
jgi:hypothetical protein